MGLERPAELVRCFFFAIFERVFGRLVEDHQPRPAVVLVSTGVQDSPEGCGDLAAAANKARKVIGVDT